jgi:hypothetical protein
MTVPDRLTAKSLCLSAIIPVQYEAETALVLLSDRRVASKSPLSPSHIAVESEPTSQALLGEQMGNRFLREKGKTQRLVAAAIEQGGLRHKVKEMARKISKLAINYWHFPK